ncbi:MAG TPA: hypothetical protein VI541_04740 [Actinomycetota bacterium]|nr:hypothetical protein [Actinomycetota bacterium]
MTDPQGEQEIFEAWPPQRPRRRRRASGGRVVFGVVLIILGVGALLRQIFPIDASFVPLAIGVGFLSVWVLGPRIPGFLITGGVMTGVGAGIVGRSVLTGRLRDAAMLVGLGLGFTLIGALSRRGRWAFIVGGILLLVGFVQAGFGVGSYLPGSFVRIALPTVVILVGVLLLTRHLMARSVFRWLLFLLIAIAALLSTSSDQVDHSRTFPGGVVLNIKSA